MKNDFLVSYLTAALWTTDDNPGSGEWAEHDDWTIENLSWDAYALAMRDCVAFMRDNADQLSRAGDDSQNGRDFWLTRNRLGTGFWDRGYEDHLSQLLIDAAHTYGETDLYRGLDGKLYFLR